MLIALTQDGVYVAEPENEVVFLPGFDFGTIYRPVTPYGAYPGTLVDMPHTLQMGWASPQGFVIADNSGAVVNISPDKVAFPGAIRRSARARKTGCVKSFRRSLLVGQLIHSHLVGT